MVNCLVERKRKKVEQIRKKHSPAPVLTSHFLPIDYFAGVVTLLIGGPGWNSVLQVGLHGLSRRILEVAEIVP